MSPELVEAIRARIEHGFTREQIREEVLAAGHEEDVFEEAYAALQQTDVSEPATPPAAPTHQDEAHSSTPHESSSAASQPAPTEELIGYGALIRIGFELFRQRLGSVSVAAFLF